MNSISNSALTRLKSHSELIGDKCRRELQKLRESIIDNYDIAKAKDVFSRLCDFSQTKMILSEISDGISPSLATVPEFIVGSELLYEAYRKLCSIKTESILYAVGNSFGNSYSIVRLIDLKLDKSEYAYASADPAFSSKELIELEEYGTLLTCYFHAHPGNGINANHPSGTDISNQQRLEKGKYNTIGGIFSRDGHLRFFSDKLQYKVTISGKGVEHVSENAYRLTDVS